MHVVLLYDHSNEFIAQNKSQNHPGYGDYYRFRQGADEVEYARVPDLGQLADLPRNIADPSVHIVEQAGKIEYDPFCKQFP